MVEDRWDRNQNPLVANKKNPCRFSKATARKIFGLLARPKVLSAGLITLLISFVGCKTKSVKVDGPLKPILEPTRNGKSVTSSTGALTALGSNFDGQFSKDGKRILFLSSGRPSHSQVQVYEKDLTTGRERRVTFHDGDTNSPRYDIKGGRIFYASTTDELKENPLFLQRRLDAGKAGPEPQKRNQWETLPTDIYASGLNGDNIQRLTYSRGFDGDISVHPKTGVLYFSSNQKGYLQIHVLDPRSGGTQVFSKEPSLNEAETAISPDGRTLAWVQYSADLNSSQILLSSPIKTEKPISLTLGLFFHLSPAWTPDGKELVFSANADGTDNYDLYIIKKDGSCLRRLTSTGAQESKPAVSPDGRQLLFSSNESGSSQLYLVSFQPPSTCPVQQ